jgi:large subunit ribosomal protein L6
MSRVGKAPIYFEKDVQITVNGQTVNLKGPKGALSVNIRPEVQVKMATGTLELTAPQESRNFHGLSRALLQNAVTGVGKGWTKELELNGVGYRASVAGKKLEMALGYSHPVVFDIPEGIEIKVDKQTKIVVTGPDRQKVGQVASVIRSFRPPEPYLGKGVKYVDERIRRKAGKAAGK